MLTITKVTTRSAFESLEQYKENPEYISYVNLLKEYFDIKNDEDKLQQKFDEILAKHQLLVKMGIIKL